MRPTSFFSVLIDLRSPPQCKRFSSAYLTNNPFFWVSFKVWSYSRHSWTKRLENPCLIFGWTLNVTETAQNPNQKTLYENKDQDCSGNTGSPTSGIWYCAPKPRPKGSFPSKIKRGAPVPFQRLQNWNWLAQENQVLLAYKGQSSGQGDPYYCLALYKLDLLLGDVPEFNSTAVFIVEGWVFVNFT